MKQKYKKIKEKKHAEAVKNYGKWLHIAHVWKKKVIRNRGISDEYDTPFELSMVMAWNWKQKIEKTKKH